MMLLCHEVLLRFGEIAQQELTMGGIQTLLPIAPTYPTPFFSDQMKNSALDHRDTSAYLILKL